MVSFVEFDGWITAEETNYICCIQSHTQVGKTLFFYEKIDLAGGQEIHLISVPPRIVKPSWKSMSKMSSSTRPRRGKQYSWQHLTWVIIQSKICVELNVEELVFTYLISWRLLIGNQFKNVYTTFWFACKKRKTEQK